MKMHLAVLAFSAIWISGCTGPSEEPNVELIQDMMESPAVWPQEYDEGSVAHRGMREPPEHTVPIGVTRYKYKGDPVGAAQNENPFAHEASNDFLQLGQKNFETQCMVCHGMGAHGDGPVSSKLNLKPPSLVSEKIRGWKDGQIFHVISEGQGLMGPYASHLPSHNDRWAVVNYIRFLQKNDTATK